MRSFGSIWNRSSPGSREATWRALAERSRNANSARLPCGTRTTALTLSAVPSIHVNRWCVAAESAPAPRRTASYRRSCRWWPCRRRPTRRFVSTSSQPHLVGPTRRPRRIPAAARSGRGPPLRLGQASANSTASTIVRARDLFPRSAAPVLHGSAARTATPRASIRSTCPHRRRCRTHTNWSTRRGWPRHGIRIVPDSPRAHAAPRRAWR